MVGAGRREPAVGTGVVRVQLDPGDGVSGARGVLLVAADEQPVTVVPRGQRPEEGLLGELRAGQVVIAPDPLGVRVRAVVVQGVEAFGEVVAARPQEGVGEPRRPAGQGRQFVLERTGHDLPEPAAQTSLELAVHPVEERRTRVRAEVVEAAGHMVMERQPPAPGPRRPDNSRRADGIAVHVERNGGTGRPVVLVDRFGVGRDRQPVRGPSRPVVAATSTVTAIAAITIAVDHHTHTFEPAPGVGGLFVHQTRLDVRARESELVVEPEADAEFVRVLAHPVEQRPPLLGQERRVVGIGSVQRSRRRQVEQDEIEHPAVSEAFELVAQPGAVEAFPAPPPDGGGREGARRLGHDGLDPRREWYVRHRVAFSPSARPRSP